MTCAANKRVQHLRASLKRIEMRMPAMRETSLGMVSASRVDLRIYLGLVVMVIRIEIFPSSAPARSFSISFSFAFGMARVSVDATTDTSCWLKGDTSSDLSTAGCPPTRSYNGSLTKAAQLTTYFTSPRSASVSAAVAAPFLGSALGGGAAFPPLAPAAADSATSLACSLKEFQLA